MPLHWVADPHFDQLTEAQFEAFVRDNPGDLVLSGDMADGFDTAARFLRRLKGRVWYVLGNHDFYGGSVMEARLAAYKLSREQPRICYLPASEPVLLDDGETAMVGTDGWADGRLGNRATTVPMRDHTEISDYMKLMGFKSAMLAVAAKFGDQCAKELGVMLDKAVQLRDHILVVTHVPPFAEASWHDGKPSGDDFLPWYTCKAVGDVLMDRARRHPKKRFTVLCGHTHGEGRAHMLENLEVLTGGAKYGSLPEIHSFQ